MWPNLEFPVDLVTFTEKILNGKLYFFVQCVLEISEILLKSFKNICGWFRLVVTFQVAAILIIKPLKAMLQRSIEHFLKKRMYEKLGISEIK